MKYKQIFGLSESDIKHIVNESVQMVVEKKHKIRKNDNGEYVPELCKCGGKIVIQIKGEPVYICKDCQRYYGTVPCKR